MVLFILSIVGIVLSLTLSIVLFFEIIRRDFNIKHDTMFYNREGKPKSWLGNIIKKAK